MLRLFVAIERWLARRTDRLIAVSPTIVQELLANGIGRREQWCVIPLGLDLTTLAHLPLPNGSRSVRIGLVGRLVPIKNPSLFLRALHRLVQTDAQQTIYGVVIGDGSLRPSLEREVQEMGLSHIVRFTGWRRDLAAVYGELDATCLTSWNEGTPAAVLETMAAGRVVVATDVGGLRDVLGGTCGRGRSIAPGSFLTTERGILVRPGDAEGLAKALKTIAADGALRGRLGEAARAYAVGHFSQERLVRDMTAFYEMVERGSRAP